MSGLRKVDTLLQVLLREGSVPTTTTESLSNLDCIHRWMMQAQDVHIDTMRSLRSED